MALVVGAFAFINGVTALALLTSVDGSPGQKLFEVNAYLGTALVTIGLGAMLVYQAASSFGNVGSSAMRFPGSWTLFVLPLAVAFPLLVFVGQQQVNNPERLPWLFPFTNLAIVSIPSLLAALGVAYGYTRRNPFAWPLSIREWTSGFIYGAVGATGIASVINTLYLVLGAALLIATKGSGDAFAVTRNLPSVPTGWGVAFDLSVLSVVAPLNEEFWKGMLVAFFFFRGGGAARCFMWGVLAGAGFNLLETFQNSLSVVSPEVVSDRTIGSQWWLFASARAGTGAVHALATGLSALGFYGLFRHKPRYLIGYPLGVLTHGTWNFLNFTLAGDAFFSQSGPDTTLLDILSVVGLCAEFAICVMMLWVLPLRLRDGFPAAIYQVLGMVPGGGGRHSGTEEAPRIAPEMRAG
ncbi:MAG: PrsW family glutamic-type intramembrane protease [Tepidiformaceae bacterium]